MLFVKKQDGDVEDLRKIWNMNGGEKIQINETCNICPSFLVLGCSQSKNKNIIAPDKGKYWDVIRDGYRVFNKPGYCYYFNSTGGCFYYYYRFKDGNIKRNLFDYGDVIYPNTWQLKSDTLEIQGFDYLIKTINERRLTLVLTTNSADTLILSASMYP